MIGKVPKAGRGFKGLVNYLLRGDKGSEYDPDRVAWTEVRNLAIDDPELVPNLMRASASRNRRCKSPVYHFVISWRNDERPTDKIMAQVADTTCEALELDEFERLYVAHMDTNHRHLHVVVNRIHPETGKAWNRRQDWVKIEQSLADQSRELGFEYVPGRHNEPDKKFKGPARQRDGKFQKTRRRRSELDVTPWSKERLDKEREILGQMFDAAQSWDELTDQLAKRQMLLVEKGQGMVVVDREGAVKVSQLGKALSKRNLEGRFGDRYQDYLQVVGAMDNSAKREKDRGEAFEKLATENAELDFAFTLYRGGLVSERQLQRLIQRRNLSADDAEATLSLREQLGREVGRSFTKTELNRHTRNSSDHDRDR